MQHCNNSLFLAVLKGFKRTLDVGYFGPRY